MKQRVAIKPPTVNGTYSTSGRDPITERHLRTIAAEVEWGAQGALWRALKMSAEPILV